MNTDLVHVFTCDGAGGNPCPIVCDATGMTDEQIQGVARSYDHESGFALKAPTSEFDYRFRFWVPNHEMEMCGHATIGALWLLATKNLLETEQVRISTLSGTVTGFVEIAEDNSPIVEITRPAGRVQLLEKCAEENVLEVLGITRSELLDLPLQNAVTSRVKTLIPVKDLDRLHALQPDFASIEALCSKIGSTGLYPYSPHAEDPQTFEARQFPRSSGYPEDAATGIAATALAFGLIENGLADSSSRPIRIMQGRAMGCLSGNNVRIGFVGRRVIGCLLGGTVSLR